MEINERFRSFLNDRYSNKSDEFLKFVDTIKKDPDFLKTCEKHQYGGTVEQRIDLFSHLLAEFSVDSEYLKGLIGHAGFQVSMIKMGIPYLYKGETVHILYKVKGHRYLGNMNEAKVKGEFTKYIKGKRAVLPFDPQQEVAGLLNILMTDVTSEFSKQLGVENLTFYNNLHNFFHTRSLLVKPAMNNMESVLYDVMDISREIDEKILKAKVRKEENDKKKESAEVKNFRRSKFLEGFKNNSVSVAEVVGNVSDSIPEDVLRWIMKNPRSRDAVDSVFVASRKVNGAYGTMDDEEIDQIFSMKELTKILGS